MAPSKKIDEEIVEKLLLKQREAFESSMKTFVFMYDEKLQKLEDKFDELKFSLEFSQNEIHELKTSCQQSEVLERSVLKIERQLSDITKDIDYIDNQGRSNNIRIDGIPEVLNEDLQKTEQLVLKTLTDTLELSPNDLSEFKIERSYRVNTGGRRIQRDNVNSQQPRCRPVFVKFRSVKSRDFVLKEFKARKPIGMYANEDYSPRVLQKRKDLLPEMYEKRREGKIAFLSYDRLIVREKFGNPEGR